jgi:hypothetical protein
MRTLPGGDDAHYYQERLVRDAIAEIERKP